jgi:hypothetical protein
MRTLIMMLVAGIGLTTAGCASARPAATSGQEQTTLVVRNDNYLDHNIYLIRGADRVRLGTARGLTTTRFVIPAQYVFGVSSLQFLADPIGSRVTPVSDRVNVSPGDEVQLVIPGR